MVSGDIRLFFLLFNFSDNEFDSCLKITYQVVVSPTKDKQTHITHIRSIKKYCTASNANMHDRLKYTFMFLSCVFGIPFFF